MEEVCLPQREDNRMVERLLRPHSGNRTLIGGGIDNQALMEKKTNRYMEMRGMKPIITDNDPTIEELESALVASPDDLEILYRLGICLFRANRLEEGEKAFQRLVRLDARSAKGFASLGVITWNRGEFEEAFTYFSRALELDPGDPDTLVNLGLISEQLGEIELAISLFQAYLVQCPDDNDTLARLEVLRLRNGHSAESSLEASALPN